MHTNKHNYASIPGDTIAGKTTFCFNVTSVGTHRFAVGRSGHSENFLKHCNKYNPAYCLPFLSHILMNHEPMIIQTEKYALAISIV